MRPKINSSSVAMPGFLPLEIANLKAQCPTCSSWLAPDLWTERQFEFGPIHEIEDPEAGAWHRVSEGAFCRCGTTVQIPINYKKLDWRINFFGDESGRQIGDLEYIGYSLIGMRDAGVEKFRKNLIELKLKHVPDNDPEVWKIHTKDILNGRTRIVHGIYKQISDVAAFINDCADLLASMDDECIKVHAMGVIRPERNKKEKRKSLNFALKTVHSAAISYAIYSSTDIGLKPTFVLDSIAPFKGDDHFEEWSQGTYLNSKRYLVHEYLSHCNDIDCPKFVPPGSHACLEIADFHAYMTARSIFKRAKNEQPELPLSRLGRCNYMILDGPNGADHYQGHDVPDKWINALSKRVRV